MTTKLKGVIGGVDVELERPEPVLQGGHELLGLLQRFYAVWNRCESTRGCYSCAEPHDCRCEKERGISEVCNCGRDELEALEKQIDEYGTRTWAEKQPTAQDVMGVLEDEGLAYAIGKEANEDALTDHHITVEKYRAAVKERIKGVK